MLTAAGCKGRRDRLWKAVDGRCDALLLADPQSLIYFANYAPSPFVFRTSDATACLILERDRATLIADSMVRPYLDEACVDEIVATDWYDGRRSAPHRREFVLETASREVARARSKRWGVEASCVAAGLANDLWSGWEGRQWLPLDTIIRALRRPKDSDELELIRRSVRAGEAGHAAALAQTRPGMSEVDVYRLVASAATERAGEPVVVYGDFVSGPRCETERGGPPSQRVIEKGDLFLLDYSVVVRGYRADFTNTFVVGGQPTDAQRRLFDTCLEALSAGEAVLRPGTLGRDVDGAIRAALVARGLEHAFKSHSGHGLGLSHPEPPFFVAESTDELVENDVVALEPGLFVPAVGGMRFEHNYRVTNNGHERLTSHRLTLTP